MTGRLRRALGQAAMIAFCAALLALAAAPTQAAAVEAVNHGYLFEVRTFERYPLAPIESLEDPCGLAVDSEGSIYVSDYYADDVLVFRSSGGAISTGPAIASARLEDEEPLDGPCGLAVTAAGNLDVNTYHRDLTSFPVKSFPPSGAGGYRPGVAVDRGNSPTAFPAVRPTGLTIDPATGRIYVDDRRFVAVYEPSGSPVEVGGEPLRIGVDSLKDGYGVAVSDYPGTAGYVYVADAATNTIDVYDPQTPATPHEEIDGEATPEGAFSYLDDAALAVNSIDGHVFVAHAAGPLYEHPEGLLDEFNAEGDYRGRILANTLLAGNPNGLAVAPPGTPGEGDLYVTSGNSGGSRLFGLSPTGPARTLRLTKSGTGAGTVTSEPAGIRCGSACTAEFNSGAEATLTAVAAAGSVFKEWSGACAGSEPTCRVVMSGNREATAVFEPASAGAAVTTAEPGRGAGTSSFGFPPGEQGFSIIPMAEGGGIDTEAGTHPYEIRTKITANLAAEDSEQRGEFTEGDIRDVRIDLPRGLVGNPDAVPKCRSPEFNTPRVSPFESSASGESCPANTQIGIATMHTSGGGSDTRTFGVFNLQAPTGMPAAFGFAPYGVPLVFNGQVRTGSENEYTLTVEAQNITQALDLYSLELTIWGVPWGVSHDGQRGNCLNEHEASFPWAKCSAHTSAYVPPVPYLSMPTYCGIKLPFTASVNSWQDSTRVSRTYEAPPLENCDSVPFDPQAAGQTISPRASSPTGYKYVLTNNNEGLLGPNLRAPSQTRTARISLPDGLTLNPSLGAGLGVCTPAQYASETAFSPEGAGCPNQSKIGTFTVESPLHEGEIAGAMYIAKPYDNPFNALLAVYLVAKAPDSGILVKLSGELEPDPTSGRLVATFQDLPQFPYANLVIYFREGQRAPLVTPDRCGTYYTYSQLFPWLGQLGEFHRSSYETIEHGIGGGACPSGSTVPFQPTANGGTLNAAAGAYSPYYLHLTRGDIDQEITSYSTALPPGLLGSIANIPFCPEAAIEHARHNTGVGERDNPSCPAASKIGHTTAGYGVGPVLTYAPGNLYLAGPYHGSPLSLVAVDSALVGPFDLGVVIVRSAIKVDPHNAQISLDSAGSDPIPHIIDGIPIHLRDIRIYIDRPQMMVNPTSCDPFTMVSRMTGSAPPFANPDDTSAAVPDRFQASNCGSLGFRPEIKFHVNASRRGAYPALTATVEEKRGDANIDSALVTLPHTEFLAQNHIRNICTRLQFAAGSCPAKSVYGHVKVTTPLLSKPMTGPVYLRSSSNKNGLPDMVVDLHGAGVEIELLGKIDSPHGGLRAHFVGLPDAPVETFSLTMFGGKRGLLQNSTNLCAAPSYVEVDLTGQSSQIEKGGRRLKARCGRSHKRHKKHRSAHRHRRSR